jgi:hypothetical protein
LQQLSAQYDDAFFSASATVMPLLALISALSLISLVALWWERRWIAWIYLISTFLDYALELAAGPLIQSRFAELIDSFASASVGATFITLYWMGLFRAATRPSNQPGVMQKASTLLIVAALCAALPPQDAMARGLLGGAIKWVGDRTGAKPLSKAGKELDNASRDIKKAVPIYAAVDEGLSRPVRETAKWIEKHPEEALAIAAVAVVGWAACVDGCAFVGGLIIDGATAGGAAAAGTAITIPLIAIEPKKEREPPSVDNKRQPAPTSNEEAVRKTPLDEVYLDKYYSKREYPSGKPPILVYRTLDERLGEIFNEFAPPSANVRVRLPDPKAGDRVGGVFESPRTNIDDPAVAKAYGKDARRIHGATDFLMSPGHPVLATMTGKIDSAVPMKNGFHMVTIVSQDETVARLLYVRPNPDVKPGVSVKAGVTPIGVAENLSTSKDYKDVPNHVHVDFTDFRGHRFDPWSNKRTEPMMTKKAPGQ